MDKRMEEKEKLINMVEGKMSPDASVMMGALISVLRMREPACGTSAMLALLSAHFINVGCSKEEFLHVCSETYSFYKLQIDEENAKTEQSNVNP